MPTQDLPNRGEAKHDVLDLLCSRVSSPRLAAPAPAGEALELVFQSALRTPDHMRLKPWRYLVIEGESLVRLGALFCEASRLEQGTLTDAQEAKFKSMPQRAPMIIVGVAKNIEHPKVPAEEQVISCGVAMAYMLLALQAQGFGGVWRTGPLALNQHVISGLGLSEHESLVGFLYIGTPQGEAKKLSPVASADYFENW